MDERAELLLMFFERAYLQLEFAHAVYLNSITCLRNTTRCNFESKQPPIGGCFNPRSGVVLVLFCFGFTLDMFSTFLKSEKLV